MALLASALAWKDQVLAAAAATALGHMGLRGPLTPATPAESALHTQDGDAAIRTASTGALGDTVMSDAGAAEPPASAAADGQKAADVLKGIAALLSSRDAQVRQGGASPAIACIPLRQSKGAPMHM